MGSGDSGGVRIGCSRLGGDCCWCMGDRFGDWGRFGCPGGEWCLDGVSCRWYPWIVCIDRGLVVPLVVQRGDGGLIFGEVVADIGVGAFGTGIFAFGGFVGGWRG